MKNPKRDENDAVFHSLEQTWESAVSMGLRRLSDDDLLRLLSEVDRRLDEPDDLIDQAFVEAPDWDDKTPAELEAIACQLERQITGGTSSSAVPVRAGLRRRQPPSPAQLSFEELESRYSPSTITLMAQGRVVYAPACTRWTTSETRPDCTTWQAPAAPAAPSDEFHPLLFDFDSEALGHMALAKVA